MNIHFKTFKDFGFPYLSVKFKKFIQLIDYSLGPVHHRTSVLIPK